MAVTGLANLAVKVRDADLESACAWYEAAGATVTEPVEWENGRRADVQLGVARADAVHPGHLRGRLRAARRGVPCTPPSSSTISTPSWPATRSCGVRASVSGTFGTRRIAFVEAPGGIRLEFMEQIEDAPS